MDAHAAQGSFGVTLQKTASRLRIRGNDDSLDLHSKSFDAKAYINAKLGEKSASQLQQEQDDLETDQSRGEQELRQMVAWHLKTFIACKDTVEMLHNTDTKLLHPSALKNFVTAKTNVQEQCTSAFEGLLERDATLQELKHAGRVFEKFQFLLTIPDAMKQDISLGEHQRVIFNYKRARHYEEAHRFDKDKKTAVLFNGVFAEVKEAVEKLCTDLLQKVRRNGIGDMAQTESLLSVLRSLEHEGLLGCFIAISRDNFLAALDVEGRDLRDTILFTKQREEQHSQQEAAWGQLQGSRCGSMVRSRAVSAYRLRYSEAGPAGRAGAVAGGGGGSGVGGSGAEQMLEGVLRHVSSTCALAESIASIERCGELLVDHLTHAWHVYERKWGEEYLQTQRLHGGAADAAKEMAQGEAAVLQLATECIAEFDARVWPIVARMQPDANSGATLKQWRAALLAVVRPVSLVLSRTGLRSEKLGEIKDRCQRDFHQQSCGKLTQEIASWAKAVQWKVGSRVSRQYPSTSLPLKFETAVLGLLELLNSTDDMLTSPDEMVDALGDMVLKAHEDFVDLLHHLAFGERHDATSVPEEEKLLMIWADCHVLERVVAKQTYEALRKWLGEEGEADAANAESPEGNARLVNSVDGLAWSQGLLMSPRDRGLPASPNGHSPQPSDSQERRSSDAAMLHRTFAALKDKLVGAIVSARMEKVCRIITTDGFLRADVNWSYAAEPHAVRAYCHDVLLNLVELHEGTVRLTRGQATRAVLTEAFNQTMGAFLHGVLSLDLFNCSDLAAQNATLQLELEVEFFTSAMAGFRSPTAQALATQATDYLMQLYVNTNQEALRRKAVRSRFMVDTQHSRVLLEALKQNPLDE